VNQNPLAASKTGWHRLRLLIVATLIALTVQGWLGDTANIFLIPSTPPIVEQSASGIFQAITNIGPVLLIHAFLGIVMLAFASVVLAFSIRSKPRNVQIPAILGLVMAVSAAIGGVFFVLSGFSNGGNSAQMGGSFIGAYAFYFIELHYTK
jgi:hypothetical protein